MEKVINELSECIEHIRKNEFNKIPFWGNCQSAMMDALELIQELKGYKDIVFSLLDVGYPHNFQKEEPWIRDYCYKITGVVKMAYDAVEEEKK